MEQKDFVSNGSTFLGHPVKADFFRKSTSSEFSVLTHNYPNGANEIELVSGSNYAYPMTNNTSLTGFLSLHIKGFLHNRSYGWDKSSPAILTTKAQKLKRQSM